MTGILGKVEDHAEEAIFHYAVQHWSIIPVGKNKRPLFPWKEFQERRPHPEELKIWRDEEPSAWAVITGPISKIFVLDFDGEEGKTTLESLKLAPDVRTGSGGSHVYVTYPDFRIPTLNAKTKEALQALWPGMDTRGRGGYAVFLGSNEAGRYEWLRDPAPLDWRQLPAALTEWLRRQGELTESESTPGEEAAPKIAAGNRHKTLLALAASLRKKGFEREEILAALVPYNSRVCSPPKPAEEVRSIADWVCTKPAGSSVLDVDPVGALIISPEAAPPFAKFEAIRANLPKFSQSWEHKRKDLKDQRIETYDMSLASLTAKVGWSDQEICDLLIAHRRKHGEPLLDEAYYQRIIGSVRRHDTEQRAQEKLNQICQESLLTSGANLKDSSTQSEIQHTLSGILGIEIRRIVRYASDPEPEFRLETATGAIHLGTVKNLIEQAAFRRCVAAACGELIPPFKPENWHPIAKSLLAVCVHEELGKENTETGRVQDWLSDYLRQKTVFDSIQEAEPSKSPFRKDGALYIFSSGLRRWLVMKEGERIETKDVTLRLRVVGAKPETINFTVDGKRCCRSAWRLPNGESE